MSSRVGLQRGRHEGRRSGGASCSSKVGLPKGGGGDQAHADAGMLGFGADTPC
jgi:hypothetical protein